MKFCRTLVFAALAGPALAPAGARVHMDGGPAWLEFDDAGMIQVQFHTVRPGEYTWSVPTLPTRA
ncbi:hypothetical protein [Mesorhizobium sp. M0488]|uniref:hypothetical protein n=1 Tax=unclassified Mesorhizobium TaxID=325217 RepID=UPI00333DB84A